MKKAYEFTREDHANILYHAQAHLHEALETLRAFRSVQELDFDPESKRENAGFWEMYALVYKAYESVVKEYDINGRYLYYFFDDMNKDKKHYHIVFNPGDLRKSRDSYIELANKIISGKSAAIDSAKKGK